ncbi:MAG: cache domain-containing protein [Candidatus Ozemobacteraceae bacterium]
MSLRHFFTVPAAFMAATIMFNTPVLEARQHAHSTQKDAAAATPAEQAKMDIATDVSPKLMLRVEQSLGAFAHAIKGCPSAPVVMISRLKHYLERTPGVIGAAFAYAPEANKGVKAAPYVYLNNGIFIEKNLPDGYDYTGPEVEWYSAPVLEKKAHWSAPYYDKDGAEIDMITYSVPIYNGEGQLLGVVTSDLVWNKELRK